MAISAHVPIVNNYAGCQHTALTFFVTFLLRIYVRNKKIVTSVSVVGTLQYSYSTVLLVARMKH